MGGLRTCCSRLSSLTCRSVDPRCEDCGVKGAYHGAGEKGKRKRWCAACAKAHPGSAYSGDPMCEDCPKRATWGLLEPSVGTNANRRYTDVSYRWCSGCAKQHEGAIPAVVQKPCEHCHKTSATHILPPSRARLDEGGASRFVSPCSASYRESREVVCITAHGSSD